MAIAVYPGGLPITEEQFERAGAHAYGAMLIGPSGASILLTDFINGRAGIRELLSRLTRLRSGARWYLIALLTARLMITTILLGLSLVSNKFQPVFFAADGLPAVLLSSVGTGLAAGFFEELGWTGSAAPRL